MTAFENILRRYNNTRYACEFYAARKLRRAEIIRFHGDGVKNENDVGIVIKIDINRGGDAMHNACTIRGGTYIYDLISGEGVEHLKPPLYMPMLLLYKWLCLDFTNLSIYTYTLF